MAIIAPADLPAVLKVNPDPMKKYVLSKLGHPVVEVEIMEDQWNAILSVAGDFIAGYFPREQKMAVFYTEPLKSTYPMPADAYWIQEVSWDPVTTRIDDVFGAESFLFNIGNISGIQNILVDYHLLQSYRAFSQKVLGTEGHWEVIGEVDGESKDQLIRLYPTPKGSYPVVVMYTPIVNHFRSPQAKQLASDMMLAEAKVMLGSARRKITGIPTPDGGSISYDGGDLVAEGIKEKEEIIEKAFQLGEPLGIVKW
tara:strand:- start:804 stop:1565 length:762 start_codon:yes stop_codon:yes gene_type:complete